jgi:hypothetical protein
MRLTFFFILAFGISPLSQRATAQPPTDLTGFWEDARTHGSAGRGDVYILRGDHTFEFVYSEYQWAGRRIVSFSGRYRIAGDSIYFTILQTEELMGGHIEWDGPPLDLGWIVEGAQTRHVKQKHAQQNALSLFVEFKDAHEYMDIGRHRFILVDRNPDTYNQ